MLATLQTERFIDSDDTGGLRLTPLGTVVAESGLAVRSAVVPRRIQMMLDWIPLGAAAGDAGLRRLMSQGEPERSQAALNELVPRLRRIRLLLG